MYWMVLRSDPTVVLVLYGARVLEVKVGYKYTLSLISPSPRSPPSAWLCFSLNLLVASPDPTLLTGPTCHAAHNPLSYPPLMGCRRAVPPPRPAFCCLSPGLSLPVAHLGYCPR